MTTEATLSNEPPQDFSPFIGRHFIYTCADGWKYEWYARNRG